MSLFTTGFWIPSSVQFGTTFLDTGLNLYDSLISTLICTLFSGIQLCMCRRISQLHLRLAGAQNRSRHQRLQGLFLGAISILLAGLWISGALIYCVQFSRNILTLRGVGRSPGNLAADSLVRACSSSSVDPSVRCFDVPLSRLEMGRRMELAFAALAQILVFITDLLLVLRCYFIFSDTPWVYITAALSLVASVAVSIFGLASLGRAGGLGSSSWDWTISGDGANLPAGFSLSMSMVSSLVVNAIVTVAIVCRVLLARRRLQGNLPLSHAGRDDVYSTAAALLIESAFPPVVFGIVASVFSSESVVSKRLAFEFTLIPKVAWLAFTALAPQLILVRILQGRAWSSGETFSVRGGSQSAGTRTSMAPISFSTRSEGSARHQKRSSSAASWGEDADIERNTKKAMYQ